MTSKLANVLRKKPGTKDYQDVLYHREQVQDAQELPLDEFIRKSEYVWKNSVPLYAIGRPVYDSMLFHVMIPEMLRRLKEVAGVAEPKPEMSTEDFLEVLDNL